MFTFDTRTAILRITKDAVELGKHNMRVRIAITLLFLLSFFSCTSRNEKMDSILLELDRTIDNRWRYEQEKLQNLVVASQSQGIVPGR